MGSDSDSQKTERIKIIQSGKNIRWLERKLGKLHLRQDEFKSIVTRCGYNPDDCKIMLAKVDNEFKAINNGGDPNSKKFRDEFKNFSILQAIQRYQLDPLTNVGAGSPDESGLRPYWILALGDGVLTYWMEPGRIGVLVGETGSGKTTRLLWLVEKRVELKPNTDAIMNIDLKNKPDYYKYCTLYSDMFLAMLDAIEADHYAILGIDEAMTHAPSTKTSGLEVGELEALVTIARKFKVTILVLLQYRERCPTILREKYHAFFDCYDYETMFVDIRLGERPELAGLEFTETIKDPPDTNLEFETDAPASFTVDFKLKEALNYLSLYEKGDDSSIIKGFREFLYYKQGKTQLEAMPKLFKKYFAWKMYQEKGEVITTRTIAKIFGIGKSTVSEWVREIEEKRKESDKGDT